MKMEEVKDIKRERKEERDSPSLNDVHFKGSYTLPTHTTNQRYRISLPTKMTLAPSLSGFNFSPLPTPPPSPLRCAWPMYSLNPLF